MKDDSRIAALVEEILDSNCTAEDACRECPELLPAVRKLLDQVRSVEAEVESVFPSKVESGVSFTAVLRSAARTLPDIPGYEIEGIIGSGGMGVVYKARHVRLNRLVAIKMLLAGGYAGPRELERFKREAEAIAALRHPNIVQIYDAGDHDGFPYFTMEFMAGGGLDQKLAAVPQTAKVAAEITATLARAVQAAHDNGIVHRDLKPANVLLDVDGTLKITDFGLAGRLDSTEGPPVTIDGARLGTPSYMSPEQARGPASAAAHCPAVDIYGLGAILYELLTGRPPFKGDSPAETERQVISDEPVPPAKLNPRTPRDLQTICLKCLQKEPSRRYASAGVLAEDVDRFQRGEPIAARPVSTPERVVRWARRKPAVAALILAAFAFVGLAVASGVRALQFESKRRSAIAEWTPRLELIKQLETNGRIQEARLLLKHPPDADVGEINDQILVIQAELDMTQRLEDIRNNRAAIVDGRFDPDTNRARSDREYEAALAEVGVKGFHDDPSESAARIRASPIRTAIVAALDDWALCTNDESRRRWVFECARLADPDPSGWRDRVRDPNLSQKALTDLASAAVVRDESVQLLVALAQRMEAAGADPTSFLDTVQQQYPGDFWACMAYANALGEKLPLESIRYYQAALAIRPDTALAHVNVGRALANVSRIAEAIYHFREAVHLEPTYAQAIGNLGLALSQRREDAEALELTRKAVALDPTSKRNHNNLAEALKTQGRVEEAIDEYRRAIELDPNYSLARINLALELVKLDRLDEATEQLEAIQRASPDSAFSHLGIGDIRVKQGKIDEAIAEFELAVQLDPKLPNAHTRLGNCWRMKFMLLKALVEYDLANRLSPEDATILQLRRIVMVQLGLGEEVRAEWARLLAQPLPLGHDDYYGYAELCLYLGNRVEYERSSLEFLARFESSSDAQICERTGRACLLADLGPDATARAASMIERALAAQSTPTWIRPYVLVAQGLARYRLGDFDGAVRAIQGDPSKVLGPFPHLVLAMAHRRAGRMDEAFRSLATAIGLVDWSPAGVDSVDAWRNHALRREAEKVVMPNLAELLAGQDQPQDTDERLALIAVCKSMQRTVKAASQYSDLFQAKPQLANRLDAGHRYSAACCAARAGRGDGQDAGNLSDEQRAHWRKQARQWLAADLDQWKSAAAGGTQVQTVARQVLQHWRVDSDLAGLRDAEALARLSPDERGECTALWSEVDSLLDQMREPVSTAPAHQ